MGRLGLNSSLKTLYSHFAPANNMKSFKQKLSALSAKKDRSSHLFVSSNFQGNIFLRVLSSMVLSNMFDRTNFQTMKFASFKSLLLN